MAIFLKPVFPDTKVVFASFALGKILVTCYIPKLEKGKLILQIRSQHAGFARSGQQIYIFLDSWLKISLGKKSLQIQAKSSDFILNPALCVSVQKYYIHTTCILCTCTCRCCNLFDWYCKCTCIRISTRGIDDVSLPQTYIDLTTRQVC